jgi:hypothetical protein
MDQRGRDYNWSCEYRSQGHEHDLQATESDHAEKVSRMKLVECDWSGELLHPGDRSIRAPSALRAPRWPGVPRPATVLKVPLQRVAIVSLVAHQPGRRFVEETASECFVDKLRSRQRGRVDRDNHRKAVSGGDRHDLHFHAPLGFSRRKAPFCAFTKLPPMQAPSKSSLPSSCSFSASTCTAFSNCPPHAACLKGLCVIWYGGYFSVNSRQCAPVRKLPSTPFSVVRTSAGVRPRSSDRWRNFRQRQTRRLKLDSFTSSSVGQA